MSDGPPPLVDSSSDEEELERWQRRRVPPAIDTDRDCDNSNHQQHISPLSNNNEDVEHVEEALSEEASEVQEPPETTPRSPDLDLRGTRQEAEQEAVEFCLARMKQTQKGLQAFDHKDFVRVLNEAGLFTPSLKPLVVMQKAQVDAFTSGQHEISPINGWMWRGRKGSGVVKSIEGLGMLQHLRDSRLIPHRLGCNCLYDHPALKHLLAGRENGSSCDAFPRLMHINPSMSGPVILRRREKGVVPGAVAFAGAEFVVVGKTVVGVEEVWEVVSELSEFFVGDASHFSEDDDESPPSPPGLEGVPESHMKHGTARSTLFVPATAEGMLTLLEGQAPADIDRFKAWHMDPQFHTISHHVWCLEDLRIFLFLHRLLFVLWVVPFTVQQLSGLLRITVLGGYLFMLACRLSAHEDWLYEYYRSGVGQAVVAAIRVLLVVWCMGQKVLKVASMLARELVTVMMALPALILGDKALVIVMAIVLVVVELTHLVAGIVYTIYRAGVDLIIACLPRVPWLASSVRFADAALGYSLNVVFVLFVASVSVVSWWYNPAKESVSAQTEKRYQELLDKTDPESKEELATLGKELVSNLRHKHDVAMERRRSIKTKGARDCFGGRRGCAHACSGALAVAAVKLKRKASSQEMAHIKLILAKSGIIRDSLVRTARVMLATAPTKAVVEVSHELFHAAYDGLIWPDEPLIGQALQSEGRDPTVENMNWHRAKWVAVAAELIVDQEHASWFKLPPGSTIEGGETFRDSNVHPAERCVHCFTRQEGSNSSAAATAATATRHRCMKTEGRKPSARFSACRSAVVKQSKRPKVLPRFELAEEKCCVIPADSESFIGMAAEYPYLHAEVRRPGVDDPERSRRLAVRVKSLDEKFEWLVSLDKEMAEARAAALKPASGPQDGQRPRNAEDEEKDDKTTQERKAAQERKARRVKARKERAKEAEAVRLQRLRELEEVIAAEEKEDGDGSGSAEGDARTDEEEEDDESLCIVCMTEKRNACLVHGKTAHLVVCLPCGKLLKKANMGCPICKRRIDVVIEAFTS